MSNQMQFFHEFQVDGDKDIFPETPQVIIPFRATGIIISVDGAGELIWSYDGINIDGSLRQSDGSATFDNIDMVRRIFFTRRTNAKPDVKVWAWHRKY